MGLWDAFKNLTKPYSEDELDDELDVSTPGFPRGQESSRDYAAAPAAQQEQSGSRGGILGSVQRGVSAVKGSVGMNRAAAPAAQSSSRGSVSMGGVRDGGSPMKLVVLKPESLEDAREAAEGLRSGNTVVLDLEETPRDVIVRLVDFVSGAAYILGGRLTRLSTSTYLVTPPEVDLSGEALASLSSLR